MFADSLLESAPHSQHRSAWTKLASVLVQSLALLVMLAIPLLQVERLQIIPPLPSIRMTNVQPPPAVQSEPVRSYSAAPTIEREFVQPNRIPSTIPRIHDEAQPPAAEFGNSPCIGNCGSAIPVTNILSLGSPMPIVSQPHPPARPPRVSQMQLGDLIHKVIPEYPIAAKQLRIQGAVVLQALVGKDGRVEHVQLISGPPLLVQPAMHAVEQWEYRPYLLNHEPMEVQTQVTVNFVLNGG